MIHQSVKSVSQGVTIGKLSPKMRGRNKAVRSLWVFLFLALLLLLTAPVEGATLAVINTNDSGAGSLRQRSLTQTRLPVLT